MTVDDSDRRTNRLLTLLSDDGYEGLRPHLTVVSWAYKKPLYEAYRPIQHVYFPIVGVASLVNTMSDGSAAEVGTIGSEGMVGIPIVLGEVCAPTSGYVQVPGTARRMEANIFRQELERDHRLRAVALRYIHAFFNQVSQISCVCALTQCQATVLSLASDDSRPDAVQRVSADPGISGNDARYPSYQRRRRDGRSAESWICSIPARPCHDFLTAELWRIALANATRFRKRSLTAYWVIHPAFQGAIKHIVKSAKHIVKSARLVPDETELEPPYGTELPILHVH